MELGLNLEGFRKCQELLIPPDVVDYVGYLRMFDSSERRLDLSVAIRADIGGSLKVGIMSEVME